MEPFATDRSVCHLGYWATAPLSGHFCAGCNSFLVPSDIMKEYVNSIEEQLRLIEQALVPSARNEDLAALAHSPAGEFENKVLALVHQLKIEHANFHDWRGGRSLFDPPKGSVRVEAIEEYVFADWIGADFSSFSDKVGSLTSDDLDYLSRLNGAYRHPRIDDLMHAVWGPSFQRRNRWTHIGHILPRSRGQMFSELFSGLDADNLLNLAPQDFLSNLVCSNLTLPLPFALYRCYLEVYARICKNQHKIDAVLAPKHTGDWF